MIKRLAFLTAIFCSAFTSHASLAATSSIEVGHYECTWKVESPTKGYNTVTYFHEIFTNPVMLDYAGNDLKSSASTKNAEQQVYAKLVGVTNGKKDKLNCRPTFSLWQNVNEQGKSKAKEHARKNFEKRYSRHQDTVKSSNAQSEKYGSNTKYFIHNTQISL